MEFFSKIIGYKSILDNFSKQIYENSFKGIFVFSGLSSTGKFLIAKNIGKYLTCIGLKDDTCRCDNCRLFPTIPDYLEINKNNDQIKIEDINNLIDFFSLVPFNSEKRVAVINNAHNLNSKSLNKLLHLLENLSEESVVIFITNKIEDISNTLLSRCSIIDFNCLTIEDMSDILKSKGYAASKIGKIDKIAHLLTNDFIENFEIYYKYYNYVPKFMQLMCGGKEDKVIDELKKISELNEIVFFLDVYYIYLCDLLKIRYGAYNQVLCSGSFDKLESLLDDWCEDVCVLMLDKLKKLKGTQDKKVNINIDKLLYSDISWCYYFISRNKKGDS